GGLPVGEPGYPARGSRLIACSVAGLAISLVSWVLLQNLAFLMLVNVAYPIRDYVSAGFHDNFLPWDGWNLLWTFRIHPASGPDPWANNYYTSWGRSDACRSLGGTRRPLAVDDLPGTGVGDPRADAAAGPADPRAAERPGKSWRPGPHRKLQTGWPQPPASKA